MKHQFFTLLAVALLGTARSLSAQGYQDIIVGDDGSITVDVYDEGVPPIVNCPSGVDLSLTLNGLVGYGAANYPNVAEASVRIASPSIGTTYPFTEDIVTVGQQRGGNCGPIAEKTLNKLFGVTETFYQYPQTQRRVVEGNLIYYYCGYGALACDSGTPTCTSSFINFGFKFEGGGGCPAVARTVYTIFLGACVVGDNYDGSNWIVGTRICT